MRDHRKERDVAAQVSFEAGQQNCGAVSYKDGLVVLSARVEPALRDYAREAAFAANLDFDAWVARAFRRAMARESADRAIAAANERDQA